MFPVFSYEVSPSEYDGFIKTTLVGEYTLPSNSLGKFATQGTQFSTFKLTAEDRTPLFITYIPEDMSHTVNHDEPELAESGAVVHSRDAETVWYLPSDVVSENHLLPELRQAFHEAFDFDDREADYRYHFPTGETAIAVPTTNPVDRLDEEVVFTAVEYIGGEFPKKFLLETDDGAYYYLRERSGSIRLKEDAGNGEEVFNAYVGREHPGTHLYDDEVLNIISAVEYITIVDDYDTEVPEEAHDEYWREYKEMMEEQDPVDLDELSDDLFVMDDADAETEE